MKYRLTEKIGSGGMAEVFRATAEGPEGFQRAFVIKRIHPRLSEAQEFVRMFVDEAMISARLIHPNIVQVFEFAYQDGGYYIVMEPVEGMDMAQLLRRLEGRREVPPPAFVAEVGVQACRGLEFAHTLAGADGKPLGIVHRDVTPPNIMVAWNGAVKILDFGIARAVQELRTNQSDAGIVKGKISYVAPELLEGQPADARSDLFSLGVVLHELLCGQRLFIGDNDLATLKKVQSMPIGPPSARNPGVKPAFDRIVLRALARDPDKRFQTARELGDELEGVTVRERYSTRMFSKKARELMPEAEARPSLPAAGTLGQNEAKAVADRSPVPAASAAVPQAVAGGASGRVATSGASGASGPVRRPTGAQGAPSLPALPRAALVAGAAPAARAAGSAPVPRWVWLAAGAPMVMAVALLIVVLQQRGGSTTPAAPPVAHAAPEPTTARLSLDSVPQGAAVATVPAPGIEPRHFGQTPVIVALPRGTSVVELSLTKPGFAPLTFRVIPDHDKDAVAPLERLPPPPVAVVPKARKLAPARADARAPFAPPATARGPVTAPVAARAPLTQPAAARAPIAAPAAARPPVAAPATARTPVAAPAAARTPVAAPAAARIPVAQPAARSATAAAAPARPGAAR